MTDNEIGWIQFGEANLIADEAIAAREIPPMILVMPDGGNSFYINNFDNSLRYEDFFIQEFIPYIEKMYRIRSEKMGIKHEFGMRDGVHNWQYWRSGLPVGLKFIGESFHKF